MPAPKRPANDDIDDDPRIAAIEWERDHGFPPTDRRDGFGPYGYEPPDAYDGRPV